MASILLSKALLGDIVTVTPTTLFTGPRAADTAERVGLCHRLPKLMRSTPLTVSEKHKTLLDAVCACPAGR